MQFSKRVFLVAIILPVIVQADGNTPGYSDVNSWPLANSIWTSEYKDINDAARLGFKYLEINFGRVRTEDKLNNISEEVARIKKIADAAGIKIWSIHLPFGELYDPSILDPAVRQKVIERIHRVLIAVKPFEASKAVLHCSFEPIDSNERAARLDACKSALPIIVADAAEFNIQITIENLPRTCLGNTSNEILYLTNGIDGIGVCFDINHTLQETPQHFVREVGSLIKTIHVSDRDKADERHWLPGEGVIEWNEVIAALSEVGYTGPFLYESHGTLSEKVQSFKQLKADYFKTNR
jgi:sugar phosphate isomerase/epimerase